jgi:transposase
VIPPRSNRRNPRAFDQDRYRARHLIENLFARLKQFRRLCVFQPKPATDSTAKLPPIPGESCHRFQ